MNNSTEIQSAGAPALILLHPDDNVLICVSQIRKGDTLSIDGEAIVSDADIGVGHKVARRNLAQGQKVFRYGAPIGSMSSSVAKGGHVHMHNMQSDYIPSHTRAQQTQFKG